MIFDVQIEVTLKESVNDPQGQTVQAALQQLGFSGVGSVRMGKAIALELEAPSLEDGRLMVADMCEKLLHNPVIETYSFEIVPARIRV